MIREHRVVTVSLLTGFLGSGKTSLLKRLLSQPVLQDTAVLINEFGEVGLDHLLIEEVDQDVVLLKSGCVCCTVRGDLRDGLDRLARGEDVTLDAMAYDLNLPEVVDLLRQFGNRLRVIVDDTTDKDKTGAVTGHGAAA